MSDPFYDIEGKEIKVGDTVVLESNTAIFKADVIKFTYNSMVCTVRPNATYPNSRFRRIIRRDLCNEKVLIL